MTAVAMLLSFAMLSVVALIEVQNSHQIWIKFIKLPWGGITFITICIYSFLFLLFYLIGCLIIFLFKKYVHWLKCKQMDLKAFIYDPLLKSKENLKYWEDYEKLYYGSFSEDRGDPSTADTLKWLLKTAEFQNKYNKDACLDFMIFAKCEGSICGFLKICYYYKMDTYVYVSYLLKDSGAKNAYLIVPEMAKIFKKMLKTQLKGCIGLLADTGKTEKGLIRLFERLARNLLNNSDLWNLDDCKLDYELPCTEPNPEFASVTSKPTALLYVRTNESSKFKSKKRPDYGEIKDILNYVYNKLYADSYPEDEQKDREYRNYLRAIYERVLAKYEKNNVIVQNNQHK